MHMITEDHDSPAHRHAPRRLPCMPITALRVLDLAARHDIDAGDLRQAVQGDPATVLALLAAARHLRRGTRHRTRSDCLSLRAAIEHLGLAAALSICLKFRLLDRHAAEGMDCIRHWRCALLTTAYARAIARRLRRHDAEQIHTAAALCHVGDLTGGEPERAQLAVWLAEQGVCEPLCALVHASGDAQAQGGAACIALAARMADVWLQPDWETRLAQTQVLADRLFGAVPDLCSWVFGVLGPQAGDLEILLQIRWLSRRHIAQLSARADSLAQRWRTPVATAPRG
ncbi:MAG TPA: HDOD domain-containing protein [Gammaproteobacteria bacterium]